MENSNVYHIFYLTFRVVLRGVRALKSYQHFRPHLNGVTQRKQILILHQHLCTLPNQLYPRICLNYHFAIAMAKYASSLANVVQIINLVCHCVGAKDSATTRWDWTDSKKWFRMDSLRSHLLFYCRFIYQIR